MVVQNGQSIISGWSDGKIRAFGPQSGKLLYTIHDAHQGAVTAISGTPDSTRIISGGEEGMVRMWAIRAHSQVMEASMKVCGALLTLLCCACCAVLRSRLDSDNCGVLPTFKFAHIMQAMRCCGMQCSALVSSTWAPGRASACSLAVLWHAMLC